MELVNDTSLCLAPLVSMRRPGDYLLTVVVKGTFELRPGAAAELAAEQLFPTGDEPYPDDPDAAGSHRYASDFAQYKPRADVLLVGTCHPPAGRPVSSCRVGFRVGPWGKTLLVVGDREWVQAAGIRLTETSPKPFAQMPLRYERSYGGTGYDRNPVGIGHGDVADESGRTFRPVPNIEDLRQGGKGSPGGPNPAGFGPLAMTWADRFAKARSGTFGKRWLKEQWPGFPDDFDWGFFNAAPSDQQLEGFLVGDEELRFDNLHPKYAEYGSRLPGLRVRCFRTPGAGEPAFEEIPLNLDTLWVDMDAECLALVWRGYTPVGSMECEEIDHLYVVTESLGESPRAAEHHREALEQRLAIPTVEEVPEESIEAVTGVDLDAEVASAQVAFREACAAAGLDPDHLPEPDAETQRLTAQILEQHGIRLPGSEPLVTREEVQARHLRGEGLAGEDLRGLDLSEMDLSGANLSAALLSGTSLQRTRLGQADLSQAELQDADLSGAELGGANLAGADLTDATLTGADLTGACLDGALLDKTRCRGAVFDGASALRASFRGADLSGATLRGSTLGEADFSQTTLDGADLGGADLTAASLVGGSGSGVRFARADLTRLRASEARLPQACLAQVVAGNSIWDGAELAGADLRYARLDGSDFSRAGLADANLDAVSAKAARFYKARLAGASVRSADLFQSTLQGADLTGTDFRGASLYGVEFLEAVLVETLFDGADLKMTKLAS